MESHLKRIIPIFLILVLIFVFAFFKTVNTDKMDVYSVQKEMDSIKNTTID